MKSYFGEEPLLSALEEDEVTLLDEETVGEKNTYSKKKRLDDLLEAKRLRYELDDFDSDIRIDQSYLTDDHIDADSLFFTQKNYH